MARIDGTSGADTLNGTALAEEFFGLAGNDIINAGEGDDYIDAGDGDDTINGGGGLNDILDYLTAVASVTVNGALTTAQNTGGGGIDTISNIEIIGGTNLNDTITGGGSVTTISGAGGDDTLTSGTGLTTTYAYGGAGNDTIHLNLAINRAFALGGDGNDIINGSSGADTTWGDAGNDNLFGNGSNDNLIGDAGDDTLNGGQGNDNLDGSAGNDTAAFSFSSTAVTDVRHFKAGGALITSADGTDFLINIENLQFSDRNFIASASGDIIRDFIASRPIPTFSGATNAVTRYTGPVAYLEYENFGTSAGDVVTGSTNNDFINLFAGDDAANGGIGDDVVDGGIGSNFLSGGGGNDTFFLDGRGGTTTWATITDFNAGDAVNIWGWNAGTSKLLLTQASGGATGYTGATFHYDLDNNGAIDTSLTFTGLSLAQVPNGQALSVAGNGYLFIG